MKVEVGESLVRSWLRHVEGCEFAELNWKPSTTWGRQPSDKASMYFERAKESLEGAIRQDQSISQFLKQSEVDVLGYSHDKPILHMADVAFHSNGLSYGDATATSRRIYKKLIRSAILALTYYPNTDTNIYFITPVITPGVYNAVKRAVEEAELVFKEEATISFELIVRDDFYSRILKEVMDLQGAVADTSEIFMRSWQLIAPFINRYLEPPSDEQNLVEPMEVTQQNTNNVRREVSEEDLIVALYLSRFDHHRLNIGNQGEAFRYFGRKLGINPGSLKILRDRFDRHVDNHRKGFDAQLQPNLQAILNQYGAVSEDALRGLLPL